MKPLQIILTVMVITLVGCTHYPSDIGDYKLVKQVFNDTEVDDLRKIITFYNNAVCDSENADIQNILDCHEQYFKRMKANEPTGSVEINISNKAQQKMMRDISPDTFKELWQPSRVWKHRNFPPLETIVFNYDGKYVNFLKAFGQENPNVASYHDTFKMAGDIAPGMFASVQMFYEDYDMRDERIKLFVAMHYLTLNEQRRILAKLDSTHNPDNALPMD